MIVVINGALCGLAAYLLSGDALRLNPFIVVGRGVGDRTPGAVGDGVHERMGCGIE